MKTYLSKLWDTEPVVITLIGSGAFWSLLFAGLSAFGHPLTTEQQTFFTGIGALIAGTLIRKQVIPSSGATLPAGTTITAPATQATSAVVGVDAKPFAAVQPVTTSKEPTP